MRDNQAQWLEKIVAIKIVSKNCPTFNPANNNVMQYTGASNLIKRDIIDKYHQPTRV